MPKGFPKNGVVLNVFKTGSVPWNKGRTKVYSEETLSKMSISQKGKSNHKNKKHTQETRLKMSESHKGKKRENVKKGELSPNWKGGIVRSKENQKVYLKNLRKSAVEILGGECVRCKFKDVRALQIDHINGGGSKERKERCFKGNFHKNVLKSFLDNENKYQLLCANCNWFKRFENNER